MEQAIKKAIEGGWISKYRIEYYFDNTYGKSEQSRVLLDPLFWQALGKADGWNCDEDGDCQDENCIGKNEWKYQWHRFIDHLAEGKDIDSFFNELLK